jgi:hypothetical protein
MTIQSDIITACTHWSLCHLGQGEVRGNVEKEIVEVMFSQHMLTRYHHGDHQSGKYLEIDFVFTYQQVDSKKVLWTFHSFSLFGWFWSIL